MSRAKHAFPTGLRSALNLRVPPVNPWRALNYVQLAELLACLGKEIDRAPLSAARLREWEKKVMPLLHESEVGVLMSPPPDNDLPDLPSVVECRYRNLRKILLVRKGIDVH